MISVGVLRSATQSMGAVLNGIGGVMNSAPPADVEVDDLTDLFAATSIDSSPQMKQSATMQREESPTDDYDNQASSLYEDS
jgi:hypothetical protein